MDQVSLDGVVAVGGALGYETLLHSYARGIYPWPHEGYPNLWFCPEQRGVLEFKDFHVSRSLEKFRRWHPELEVRFNRNFDEVIQACSLQNRKNQDGTWINSEVVAGYQDLYKRDFAWTAECWNSRDNLLLGGLYGVNILGVFSGESMFYKATNASKIALWGLIERLKENGIEWIDTQMVTPIVEQFGGKYVPRQEYLKKYLKKSQEKSFHGHIIKLS